MNVKVILMVLSCLPLVFSAFIRPASASVTVELTPPRPEAVYTPGTAYTVSEEEAEAFDFIPDEFYASPLDALQGSKGYHLIIPAIREFCTMPGPGPDIENGAACVHEQEDIFAFDPSEPEAAGPMPVSLEISYALNDLAVRAVERNVKIFSEIIRDRFAIYLSRSGRYLKMMKEILTEEGLPEDLAFLPIVESGFNVKAYSRSRAAGPWQFIASTARRYGLKVDWWVDERRDPVKSTRAAARYLKDLYGMFDSWSLALAAYNAGEGRVQRALRRTNHQDIWGLIRTRHLRTETKNYVPRFIAARLIATNPQQYGFDSIEYEDHFAYDEVALEGPLMLDIIARCAESTEAVIKDLNPELRRSSTPPYAKNYVVRIPQGTKERFIDNLANVPEKDRFGLRTYIVRRGDTVWEISKKTGIPKREIISFNRLGRRAVIRPGQRILLPVPMGQGYGMLSEDLPTVNLSGGAKAREYRVRRGDTLWDIARKAGVSMRELMRLNRLSSNSVIRPGQKLLLPVNGGYAYSLLAEELPTVTLASGVKAKEYRVQRGDTVWDIARKAGVSMQDIMKLNGLGRRSSLRIGQLLYLPLVEEN